MAQFFSSILEVFAENVASYSEKVAVVDSEGSGLSYAELDALSSDLALVLNVFDSSSKVGVYLNRSPEFIVSILGILKSGRAFVSLDIELSLIHI